MSTDSIDIFYHLLIREIRRGRVTPFLGAGVNLCGRPKEAAFRLGEWLPSGKELAHHLAEEFSFPAGRDDTDLLRVSQWVTVKLDNAALYAELHHIFDHDYRPTAMHHALAKLPAFVERERRTEYPLLITTNYDDALEQALTDAHVEFDLLTYVATGVDKGRFRHRAPNGETTVITIPNQYDAVSLAHRTVVVKIHGAVQRRALDEDLDSYVVTEDDYIDCLTRTDIVELLPSSVVNRMMHCHYLFLGYSLRDWNLRAMLHRIRRDQALGNSSWVVQPDPDELEEKAWENRNVTTQPVSLEEFSQVLDGLMSDAHDDGPSQGQLAS
jgi:hypothetical protein